MANPLIGTGLHAIGGISASTCYTPYQKIKKWSWETFWLVQACFAWIIMPIILGVITVPNFFEILSNAPKSAIWGAFLLGSVYGFGGMSFGFSIKHIGYSLTYTIAIGISAVLGTIFPLLRKGVLTEHFSLPGGNIVIIGMVLSIVGVALCGVSGFHKEKDITEKQGKSLQFNMLTGLILAIIGGVLSGVFNVSLEEGQPISDMVVKKAEIFQGNAKLIVSTSGCFIVNLVWFLVLSIRKKTLIEFTGKSGIGLNIRLKNFSLSALAGTLWSVQFFFYGLGHVFMGKSQYVSWVLHMSMLIFFSYIVGIIMKEWKDVKRKTYILLVIALLTLVISFLVTCYGSMIGEAVGNLTAG